MSKITPNKEPLTERQARILAAIVREYSNNPRPVGSEEINEKYRFDLSSATIRNECAALEKMGFIKQPHTSAGRVPTDIGYRFFINELMQHFELTLREQQSLRLQLAQLQKQHHELGKNIARLLADQTNQAAFALLPEESSSAGLSNILSHPEVQKQEAIEVVQFFENIDEYGDKMLTTFLHEQPEALIGKTEHQLPQISDYSLVVSRVNLPKGKKGLIGILGPKSMRYDKNMSLVEFISKFLSGSGLLLLIFLYK